MRLPDRVDRFELLAGYPATAGTVAAIASAIRDAAHHPRLRARARHIFAGVRSLDVPGEIRAVWDFVLRNVRYMRDPVGAEHVTLPVELDQEVDEGNAGEDCDGIVAYAGALLAAAGIPSELVIIGRNPKRPDVFRHIYLDVINPRTRERVHFDPVAALEFPDRVGLGDTVHRDGLPIERWDLNGRKVVTMEGLFSDGDDLLGCGADGVLGEWTDWVKGIFSAGESGAKALGYEDAGGMFKFGAQAFDMVDQAKTPKLNTQPTTAGPKLTKQPTMLKVTPQRLAQLKTMLATAQKKDAEKKQAAKSSTSWGWWAAAAAAALLGYTALRRG